MEASVLCFLELGYDRYNSHKHAPDRDSYSSCIQPRGPLQLLNPAYIYGIIIKVACFV
jgi:hypothetical protein